MTVLSFARVSFAHADDVPLFREVDLRLGPGWTGVVGENGAGKTTLLRLLAGELQPDAGEVRASPRRPATLLCPQTVEERTPEIAAFAGAADRAARRQRGLLDLRGEELERWSSLSPGERKRWQIGAALAAQPEVLLLDEPTNHLDGPARALLANALRRFDGVGVLVSHDRELLNTLTTATVRLRGGSLVGWRGAYDAARASWEAAEREQRQRYARLRGEQRKLERRIADRRRERERAEARMRTSRRMKGAHDSDARLRFKAKRRRSAEVSLGREIHKAHGALDRLSEEAAVFRFDREHGRSLFVDFAPAPAPRLLELRAPELGAGGKPLLRDVDLQVGRDSRIRVAGPNGVGKTTLLEALLAGACLPRERLLYLPQELGAREALERLEALRALPADERGRVSALVAALGVDPERLLRSRRPSPGEARKLALAWGLGRQVWLLVLDEPTNHLDLPSIERLEVCLGAYPGALLLVTHDEYFARRCTALTWRLAAGGVRVVRDPPGSPTSP